MEPLASVADKIKSFAKSGEDFFSRVVARRENSSRRNPIEILKRLQREAFSDIMKLRDRQEKTEKLLTFYRTSKGGPFQEDGTRVKGQVDLLGALLLVDDVHPDELRRAGIRTGMRSRITFETTINQRDTLEMELVTTQKKPGFFDDVVADALSISKVCYTANVADWLSLVALPIGAHCKDVAARTSSSQQEKGLSDYSSSYPPLMNLPNGSAIGLLARKRNIVASLAQFDSGLGTYANPIGSGHWLSTFGQIVCQLPKSTKVSLFGLRQFSKPSQHQNVGPFTIPLGILKRRKPLDEQIPPSDSPVVLSSERVSTGSVAVMLETELDEFTRLHGWVQTKNTNPGCIQWAVGLSDTPEDELGWGVSLGGMAQGPGNQDHYQVEAFLKLNLAKKFSLQPGLMYMMDGSNRMPAITFRSNWSI